MKKLPVRRLFAAALIMILLLLASCKYDLEMLDREPQPPAGASTEYGYSYTAGNTTAYSYVYSGVSTSAYPSVSGPTASAQPSASAQAGVTQNGVTQSPVTQAVVTVPVATAPTTAAQATQAANYASYTPAQVVDLLSRAVNKTKSYTGAITVHHKESFDNPSVTNIQPGGAVMQPAIDFVMNLVVKPTEENYQFSGGYATTSEGEQTQLLLPKAAPFSLSAAGVQSATAAQENGMVHVKVTLKPEQCTSLSQVPTYNASSIGYLDIASKFSILQIQEVNIQYPGSTIDAYIRPDGYVQSVTYVISLSAHAKAKAMGITGSADFSGNQTEVWNIQW